MRPLSLQQRIEQAVHEGRTALIPFITAGFPEPERFAGIMRELDASGADIIEIGVPFSDPVADGPVVEEASRTALAAGVSLDWTLEQLAGLRSELAAGLVLMGYYNPFLQYGLERLAQDAARAGVQGFIVPDLPLDEDGPLRAALAPHKLDLIALVGPNTGDERMRAYAAAASGYVYVVSVMGTTGVRRDLPMDAAQTVRRAQAIFHIPVALGFGIHSPEQIRDMPSPPQAVVFGSALLRHLAAGNTAKEFMAPWTSEQNL
ncbi:MAG: tryptophan synthase subunit alpha [Deltaproteobacteria bacterium]|jgi:tryptophan synthase alpha chain|nr:tryptophan synthase subunit alpha [Deltaproteobacteria bacterium]